MQSGLYVVGTPIGNLSDMSPRAVDVLRGCDLVAAEDTRVFAKLAAHFDIKTKCVSCHEHNELRVVDSIIEKIQNGAAVATVSDAGMPGISDPGFRIVAVCLLVWYMCRLIRKGEKIGYLICIALITAGALGNIIDCIFYGVFFNAPAPPYVAHFVEWGYGYDVLMRGRVVDMLYFPLVSWDWPSWMPVLGSEHFIFFSPIFNLADTAISCGVAALIVFYHERFQH